MLVEGASETCPGELERTLERQIALRTWGRVHRLQVERTDGRVIVRGCTSSYHVKQLALHAVLEVLGTTDSQAVELQIRVDPATLRTKTA